MRWRPLRLSFLLLLLLAAPLFSQTNTAEIVGTVLDTSGALLPGATIVANRGASGFSIERISDDQGAFLLPALPVGEYSLTVELLGFKRLVRRGVVLRVGQRVSLELVLELGEITENITVSAEVPLLEKANAEINDIIENERVAKLPLNSRHFLQLALLSEGVVKPPGGTRGAALQQTGSSVNVGGQRAGHNIYMLDGVKVTDELFNNLVVSPSVDAIQEFKIQKTMYSAEFGGKASALINVVMKSGTNEYHGNLYEFHRNAALDARNFFDRKDSPIPPFVQNQFGGTLGGPLTIPRIYEGLNKTFFFINYEGQRIRKSITKTFSVPTAALRSGDFSGLETIYDPLSTDPRTGARRAFPENRIPRERQDPVALAFLEKVPLPNRPGTVQNLVSSPSQRTDLDQFNLRLDHFASPNDSLFSRFSVFNADEFQPFGTTTLNEDLLTGFGRSLSTRSRNLAVGYTHTFGNGVVNELRLGWMRVAGGQTGENRGFDFASVSGLQGVTQNPMDMGFPLISFAGEFNSMGDPQSFIFRDNENVELFENILIRHGTHQIKFGGYWFHLRFNPSDPEAARGVFSFTPRFTSSQPGLSDGSSFADFLLGHPSSAKVGIGRGGEDGRTNWFHFFIQDDWRVHKNLTLNIGFRYEANQQMRDIENRLSAIDATVPGGRFVIASDKNGNISPEAEGLKSLFPIPAVTSAEAGWPRSLLRPSYKRFAPRLGLAWELPGPSQTVLRAGFGIFPNQWAYSVQLNLARNLPFFFLKQVDTSSEAPLPPYNTADVLTKDVTGSVSGANVDFDFRTEYTETWTLGVQHLFTPSTVLEAYYTGSHTVGADNSTVRNVPLPGPGAIDTRRPIPSLSEFKSIRWDGWSTYHALSVKLERRFTRGLFFNANYAWSKTIDDASAPGGTSYESNLPQDVRNLDAEKALSSYHHASSFTSSFTYDFPFQRNGAPHWIGKLLSGWRTTGIVTLQTGAPFTVNTSSDPANIGPGPAQRPNLLRNPNLPASQRSPERWFDTKAFTLPEPYSFGTAGRNTVFGPGFRNFDLSLIKTTALADRGQVEFRFEVFNVLNITNFDIPNRFAFTPNFGRIFSAGASRQIQFAVKLSF